MVGSRWIAQRRRPAADSPPARHPRPGGAERRRHRLWLVVLCLLLVGALLPLPASAQSPVDGKATSGDPYFPGLGNGGYDVRQYDIALRIDPKRKVMNGTTTITLTPAVPLRSFTFDFIGFEVTDVTVDGVAARSKRERDGYKLRITPAQPLAAGTAVAVAVTYRGKPDNPRKDTGWAWFKNGGALFDPQPSGARTVFPCNDYPADKATFRYELTTPRGLPGIANGLPSAATVADGWETVTWTEANPFPTYAALVAVGNFTLEETVGPTGVPILNALPAKHATRLSQRVRRQGQMVEVLTAYLGPYPYGSIGAIVLPRANPSAMEAATRPTYPGIRWALKGKSFEQVVAHEVAHMWLGNTVTNTNWRDIWLNEGFATYGELIWIAETRDVPIAKLFARNSRVFSYGKDLETVKPGNPGGPRIFNTSVYNRGALTLEALRRTVGNDDFYAILREWVARYGGGNATTRDFIALSEEISGQQLDRLFERWLYGNGLPKLPQQPGVSGDALLTAAELERLDGLSPVGPEKGPAAAPREAPAERRAAPRGGRE